MKKEFTYKCECCGRVFEIDKDLMLCPFCSRERIESKPFKGVLKVQLPSGLMNSKKTNDEFDIFDYLPVEKEYFPKLPVGNTPLIEAKNIQKDLGFEKVFLKFDGTNPTGSFKDRASFLVSAFAKKYKKKEIVVASTGNAASSMSGIAAAAEQKVYVLMPESAPKAKIVQCLQYGAEVIPIKGNYDKAFELSIKLSSETGFFNRNTAFNPMTIEGKKTVAIELSSQLNGGSIDYVFVPVGDGVILDGVIKGFLDMLYLGLINFIPKIIGVQAKGSPYIFNAFYSNKFNVSSKAKTIADSISVDVACNAFSAVRNLKKVDGEILLVSDKEILAAQHYVSKKSGIFCEPSSAAAFAGFLKMKEKLQEDKSYIILLTGSGLKDIDSACKGIKFPNSFEPDLNLIMKKLKLK